MRRPTAKNSKHSKNSKHWLETKNGLKGFLDNKKHHSEALKKEREEYKLINDFKKDEVVTLTFKGKEIESYVIRVYDRSYKIALSEIAGKLDYVLIDKKSLSGYSNYIKTQITGDGRRYIGENYSLLKL